MKLLPFRWKNISVKNQSILFDCLIYKTEKFLISLKKNNFCEWWLWIDHQITSTIPTQYVLPTFLCLNLKSLEQEAPVPWIVLRKAGDILWSYHKKRIFNSPGSTCLMILAKVILKIPHYDIQSWLPLRAFIFSVCD